MQKQKQEQESILISKIKEKGLSVKDVADMLHINKVTLYRKARNNYFLCHEMFELKKILGLTQEETENIFIK